jgi:DNA repair exonuclease SbcCD nuclease subunit
MSFNILCIGDIHIQTNNTIDIKIFTEKLYEYIKDNNELIDIVVLMGDILHTHERLHTIPFNIANNMIEQLSIMKPLYILVGNHDYINNSQFLTDNHWMNCFKNKHNIHIVDKAIICKLNNKTVIMCPYVPDGTFIEALNTLQTETFDWKKSDCILGHQLLDGAKMGAIVAENIEKWDDTFPYLISGHIHDKQKVQNNLYYTGSSIQHAFGESSDKTICLVKIKNSLEIQEIDLKLPKKQILYYDIENIDPSINKDGTTTQENELMVQKILNILDTPDIHYKITLTGNFEQFKVFKKNPLYLKLQKNNTKIVFKNKLSDILNKKHLINTTLNNLNKLSFQDILLELVKNDENINIKHKIKLENLYNTFSNGNEVYNNKFIELID